MGGRKAAASGRKHLARGGLAEIRHTGDRGAGVFALRELDRGTEVFEYRGERRWIWEIPRWNWEHCFQCDYDRYFVPRAGSIGWFFNHSCDPNCWVSGERSIVTMRRVEKGEELTFDYSTNVGWDGFLMPCRCGKKNCRRVVTDYSRLPAAVKTRYGNHISPFLLKRPGKRRPSLF